MKFLRDLLFGLFGLLCLLDPEIGAALADPQHTDRIGGSGCQPGLTVVCGPVYSPLAGITSFLNASSPPAINTSIANEEVFVTWT